MPVSEVLKKFRSSGYDEPEKSEAPESPRVIQLTDDEMKYVAGQGGPGEEVTCEVTGRLEKDGHFHVMSVSAPGGGMDDEGDMAAEVAGQSMPMMRSQTTPSPS